MNWFLNSNYYALNNVNLQFKTVLKINKSGQYPKPFTSWLFYYIFLLSVLARSFPPVARGGWKLCTGFCNFTSLPDSFSTCLHPEIDMKLARIPPSVNGPAGWCWLEVCPAPSLDFFLCWAFSARQDLSGNLAASVTKIQTVNWDLVWTMGRLITKHTRTSFSPFSSLLIQLVSLFLKLSPSSTTWLSDFTHSSNSLTALSLIIISVLKTRC